MLLVLLFVLKAILGLCLRWLNIQGIVVAGKGKQKFKTLKELMFERRYLGFSMCSGDLTSPSSSLCSLEALIVDI